MIWILLSILSSSLLFLGFKLFKRYHINNLQAIVFNYFTASLLGFILILVAGARNGTPEFQHWWWQSILMGMLFIVVFYAMALSSQHAGIAITSVAAKMEVIIPVLSGVLLYHESLRNLQWAGIALAIVSIIIIIPVKGSVDKKSWYLPLFIFFGSGIIDSLTGYFQKHTVPEHAYAAFSSFIFLTAGIAGLFMLIISRNRNFSKKNMLAGIALGIPNFFSIYFLLKGLNSRELTVAASYAWLNTGTVVVTSVTGILFLHEKLNIRILAGILAAITALVLIAI